MSEPVELAFREQLAARFSADLGLRVYDLVSPVDATLPLATYRRVSSAERERARIRLTLRDGSYSNVKRLQEAIERYFEEFRANWLGTETCVWVYAVRVTTLDDGIMGATRDRLASSEFDILYAIGD